jgi:hypothetical protein
MSNKYDVFSLFESLLTDEENEYNQSNSSELDKQNKLKQAIKKRDVVSKKSNKSKGTQLKDKSEDDDIDDSNEEDNEDKKVYDDNKGPKSINLKDALELSKQIKALNKFKASQSLKDPEINEELEKYFKNLSDEEKYVLYVLVNGLVQVALSDIGGDDANIPTDFGLSVKKSGITSSEKAKSKETKMKLKAKSEDKDKVIDDIDPPIKVGVSEQDKSLIHKTLLENRRN